MRCGKARSGGVRCGMAGKVRCGQVRSGGAWRGMAGRVERR